MFTLKKCIRELKIIKLFFFYTKRSILHTSTLLPQTTLSYRAAFYNIGVYTHTHTHRTTFDPSSFYNLSQRDPGSSYIFYKRNWDVHRTRGCYVQQRLQIITRLNVGANFGSKWVYDQIHSSKALQVLFLVPYSTKDRKWFLFVLFVSHQSWKVQTMVLEAINKPTSSNNDLNEVPIRKLRHAEVHATPEEIFAPYFVSKDKIKCSSLQ